jgi:hypothetical protein
MTSGITLITGASRGIGYEMARILASHGNNLLLVSRNENELKDIASNFNKDFGVDVYTYAIDLSEANAANILFEHSQRMGYQIDMLINNAGYGMFGDHVDIDIQSIRQMLSINITTLTELCTLFGSEMKSRRFGRILNIASAAAYQPTPYLAAYGASKSFVLNFSEALCKELEDYNVTVSCLCPGSTDTNFFNDIDYKKLSIVNPLHKSRRLKSEKVAIAGVNLLLSGNMNRIVGVSNHLLAFTNRFSPRWLVATVSKLLLSSTK